jgi:DedD protein
MKQGWSSFMDRRVKERLVGATILVVLVVLIVPELLSGPKRAVMLRPSTPVGAVAPLRSVTVDLATNKAIAANTDAAASAASAGVETPAASGDPLPDANSTAEPSTGAGATDTTDAGADRGMATPGAAPPGVPSAAPQTSQPTPTPLESGAASPKSGQATVKAETPRHGWSAQLGSFAARANAERLERQLRAQGFSPFLSSTGSGRALRYRVRVGPVADRAAAEKVIARLQKAGHPASVIAP